MPRFRFGLPLWALSHAFFATGPWSASSFQIVVDTPPTSFSNERSRGRPVSSLAAAPSEDGEGDVVFAENPRSVARYEPTEADEALLDRIRSEGAGDPAALETALLRALPTMNPGLVVTLRRRGGRERRGENDDLAAALESVTDTHLRSGRSTLEELLDCGELRKLDAAIGRASREGRLDMAFFTVLNLNLNDAGREEGVEPSGTTTNDPFDAETQASRYSVLKHISTRCQEEVEKTVDPGVALLNKLLRTEDAAVRRNQLEYYLLSQEKNVVIKPDGTELDLGFKPAEVSIGAFVGALANAVERVRAVQTAGGTDRATAATLVEDIRQVAISARTVIAERYGMESAELLRYQDDLQPVFRPQG